METERCPFYGIDCEYIPVARKVSAQADEIERLREALEWYRQAVVIDATMEGPRFMGCNRSALRRAWEKDCAALKESE